ncbi:MAG TPA: hypothetical protein VGB54_00215 [Allosphingosinicella sp.]
MGDRRLALAAQQSPVEPAKHDQRGTQRREGEDAQDAVQLRRVDPEQLDHRHRQQGQAGDPEGEASQYDPGDDEADREDQPGDRQGIAVDQVDRRQREQGRGGQRRQQREEIQRVASAGMGAADEDEGDRTHGQQCLDHSPGGPADQLRVAPAQHQHRRRETHRRQGGPQPTAPLHRQRQRAGAEQQGHADHGRRHPFLVENQDPHRDQQRAQHEHVEGDGGHMVLDPGYRDRRHRDRGISEPCRGLDVAARGQDRHLRRRDRHRLDPGQRGSGGPQQPGDDAEPDGKPAGHERILRRRPEQEQRRPGETGQHRHPRQPAPFTVPGDREHRHVEERDISEQGQRAGVRIADQSRGQEPADQAEGGGADAEPQRQAERTDRDRQHQHRRRVDADESIEDVAAVDGGIEHGEPRPDQGLGDARIVSQPLRAMGPSAKRHQNQPEQGGGDHPHIGRNQPDLDRITDQEYRRDDQRDAADPDQQPSTDQIFEEIGEGRGLPRFVRVTRSVGSPLGSERGAARDPLLQLAQPDLEPQVHPEQGGDADDQQSEEKVRHNRALASGAAPVIGKREPDNLPCTGTVIASAAKRSSQ